MPVSWMIGTDSIIWLPCKGLYDFLANRGIL